jgi:hypothetical protein
MEVKGEPRFEQAALDLNVDLTVPTSSPPPSHLPQTLPPSPSPADKTSMPIDPRLVDLTTNELALLPPVNRVLSKDDGPLCWIDCEMTGLDLGKDRLLEVSILSFPCLFFFQPLPIPLPASFLASLLHHHSFELGERSHLVYLMTGLAGRIDSMHHNGREPRAGRRGRELRHSDRQGRSRWHGRVVYGSAWKGTALQ